MILESINRPGQLSLATLEINPFVLQIRLMSHDTHLQEEEVARDGVGAAVHGERLPVRLPRRQRLQVDVVGGLKRTNEWQGAFVLSLEPSVFHIFDKCNRHWFEGSSANSLFALFQRRRLYLQGNYHVIYNGSFF